METTTMTVEQGITEIIRRLNAISVPVGLLEQIGDPIRLCAYNLQLCLDALRKSPEDGQEEGTDLSEIEEVLEDEPDAEEK